MSSKISALTAITGAHVDAAADVLTIVDTSASQTKKILIEQFQLIPGANWRAGNGTAAAPSYSMLGSGSYNTGWYYTGGTMNLSINGTGPNWLFDATQIYPGADGTQSLGATTFRIAS